MPTSSVTLEVCQTELIFKRGRLKDERLNKLNVIFCHCFFTIDTKEFHVSFVVFGNIESRWDSLIVCDTFGVDTPYYFVNFFRQVYFFFPRNIVILDLNERGTWSYQRNFTDLFVFKEF